MLSNIPSSVPLPPASYLAMSTAPCSMCTPLARCAGCRAVPHTLPPPPSGSSTHEQCRVTSERLFSQQQNTRRVMLVCKQSSVRWPLLRQGPPVTLVCCSQKRNTSGLFDLSRVDACYQIFCVQVCLCLSFQQHMLLQEQPLGYGRGSGCCFSTRRGDNVLYFHF